ncbi:MAG TPA: maleylpyruvate isomerase family mycothiol-dependent enzyme [Nocardioides sp.]|uniref:maleylpyruvate isomerase family mycothiol-dependent enzyme n=1 Tax=Nocardioides sp. TaxID=35761 RepID=UPI002ED87F73
MAMPLDQRERLALCDLLLALGPGAPTLCEGWTTLDLAVHLDAREHPVRRTRARIENPDDVRSLIARLRSGPPVFLRAPGLRKLFNGLEFFIHHEDVRRANGLPARKPNEELEDLSWGMLAFLGRHSARGMRPFCLRLESQDGRRRTFGTGAGATVRGRPSELVLYFSGRQNAAVVETSGEPLAIAALSPAVKAL